MSKQTYPFSEPVGGVPVNYDLVPSLLFGIGFAISLGISVFHKFNRHRRSAVTSASLYIALERIVLAAMRMAGVLRSGLREDWALIEWEQIALSCGFITLCHEQICLIICALVYATRDGMTYQDWELAVQKSHYLKEKRNEERARYRKWGVRIEWVMSAVQWIQIVVSFKWTDGTSDRANLVNGFRWAGNMLCLMSMCGLFSMLYRFKKVENINQTAIRRIKLTLSILLVIPLFRAAVSFRTGTTLASSPQSAIPAKVAFYLLQLLPEMAACLITTCTDYRTLCDTGIWGDHPRHRVENGQPAIPTTLTILGQIFRPWKWAAIILAWKLRREKKQKLPPRPSGLFLDDDREKLLPSNSSSVGWQSSMALSTTGGVISSQIDEEKQSLRSDPSSTYSKEWSSFGSNTTITESKSAEQIGADPHTFIIDVKLWRPRLLPAFSYA